MIRVILYLIIALLSIFKIQCQNNKLLNELDNLIIENKYEKITSVVISQNNNIIFEKYYNGADKETLHNTRSATKSITSTLIGTLIKNGLLKSEKEKASKFFNVESFQNPDKRKDNITIEDLLTMSSILECDDWNQSSRGNEERMYLIENWSQFYWNLPIKGFPAWKNKPQDSKYGRSFSYCTAGTVVLGEIIENITGSLENYADKYFFQKLDIKNYKWQKTPTEIPMTGGGLALNSKDLLKIGQLYLNNGKYREEQIISENWVKKSTSPKASMEIQDIEYGYLFWLSKFNNEDAFYMTGTGGNKVVVIPSLKMVAVLTSTNFNGGMQSHNNTKEILEKYIIPFLKN